MNKNDIRRILEYANNLNENKKSKTFNSLHEGIGGVMMLNYYFGTLYNIKEYLEKAEDLFLEIQNIIINGDFKNCTSFANGLPGLCWLLNYYSALTHKDEFKIGEDIENIIKKYSIAAFNNDNPDPLYGGMGGLYYFALKSSQYNKNTTEIFETFLKKGRQDDNSFKIYNRILENASVKEYDLGFAHGLAGYLSITSLIKKQKFKDSFIRSSLKYINSQYRTDYISRFPASIDDDETIKKDLTERYNIRIGWCYGDLSIATMYMHLFKHNSQNEYYQKSINLALETLNRKSLKLSHVNDIYFCHGSSYLYFIYYKFYKITNDKRFLEQSDYWRNYTLNNLNMANEMKKSMLSFLNGLAGVLFVWLYVDEQIINDDFFQSYFINI